MEFLFWLFFAGLIIASLQDLKRREVDNWLNLFLIVASFGFIVFSVLFGADKMLIVFTLVSFLLLFILANILYYARFFAGGDAKLLFAMFALFVSSSFVGILMNIGIFVLLMIFAGAVWGLLFGGVLFLKNFDLVKKQLKKDFKGSRKFLRFGLFFILGLLLIGFLDKIFWVFALFFAFAVLLFIFAKSIETCVLVKRISYKDLREGDVLVQDVRVGRNVVKKDWEGLSKKEIEVLKKARKNVLVREGIPFVPGILIAFLVYWFYAEEILRWVSILF